MKLLPFYKLYDWMLEEFGASTDAALIAVIYSFEELGTECRLSYTQFAELLKVSRPKAIDRIRRLIEYRYLLVTRDSTHTNIYKVNHKAFHATSNGNGTSNNSASNGNGTSTSNEKVTSTSNGNGTSTSNGNVTQIENKRELKRELKREGERSGKAAAPPTPHTDSEKGLTSEQIAAIKALDFSALRSQGKDAEHYISLAKQYGFAAAMRYAKQDLKKAEAEEAAKQKPTPRAPQRSHTEPEQLGHINLAAIQAQLDAGGIYEPPKA